MLMSLSGLSRKEVAGIIGECLEVKPEYKGGRNAAESIKIITREASERIG